MTCSMNDLFNNHFAVVCSIDDKNDFPIITVCQQNHIKILNVLISVHCVASSSVWRANTATFLPSNDMCTLHGDRVE